MKTNSYNSNDIIIKGPLKKSFSVTREFPDVLLTYTPSCIE